MRGIGTGVPLPGGDFRDCEDESDFGDPAARITASNSRERNTHGSVERVVPYQRPLVPTACLGSLRGKPRPIEPVAWPHARRLPTHAGHAGWVARAWLAEECSPADRENIISLTTLGTPNCCPGEEAGVWAAVDQTRGLLKNINARFPGAHVDGVKYTSVVGTGVEGEPTEMTGHAREAKERGRGHRGCFSSAKRGSSGPDPIPYGDGMEWKQGRDRE